VAFYPDVASAAAVPVAFYPAGVGVWGLGEVAGNPDVAGTVPAVKAGLPDQAGVRGDGNDLYGTRWRRADADDDLCAGRGCRKSDAEGCDEEWLLELHGVDLLPTGTVRRGLRGKVVVRG
jgi:hypothetical protein